MDRVDIALGKIEKPEHVNLRQAVQWLGLNLEPIADAELEDANDRLKYFPTDEDWCDWNRVPYDNHALSSEYIEKINGGKRLLFHFLRVGDLVASGKRGPGTGYPLSQLLFEPGSLSFIDKTSQIPPDFWEFQNIVWGQDLAAGYTKEELEWNNSMSFCEIRIPTSQIEDVLQKPRQEDVLNYTTPYLEMMQEAIEHFGITEYNVPTVEYHLEPWFIESMLKRGLKPSKNKAGFMSTFVRPVTAKGGARPQNGGRYKKIN